MLDSLLKIFKNESILAIGTKTTNVLLEENDVGAKLKKITIFAKILKTS
jgi:hypothetical protein